MSWSGGDTTGRLCHSYLWTTDSICSTRSGRTKALPWRTLRPRYHGRRIHGKQSSRSIFRFALKAYHDIIARLIGGFNITPFSVDICKATLKRSRQERNPSQRRLSVRCLFCWLLQAGLAVYILYFHLLAQLSDPRAANNSTLAQQTTGRAEETF